MKTENKAPFETGTRLRNGAVVIDSERTRGGDIIILARWTSVGHDWITWQSNEDGETYWGHYHETFDAAYQDYRDRLG